MTPFFTSDTHFNHVNIIRLAGRPFATLEEMNEAIIANWNAVVPADGLVYHLGDFCMGQRRFLPDFRKRLNGQIILVKGNHDYDKTIVGHFDKIIWGPLAVSTSELQTTEGGMGQLAVISHEPIEEYANTFLNIDCPVGPIINLCGHVHGSWNQLDRAGWKHYNVGVDVRDFKPVTFAEIMAAPGWQLPMCRWHHKQTDLGG